MMAIYMFITVLLAMMVLMLKMMLMLILLMMLTPTSFKTLDAKAVSGMWPVPRPRIVFALAWSELENVMDMTDISV